MERIKFNLKKLKIEKTKITNERQELIKQFLDRINAERAGTKWKPLSARAVAIKVGHIPTSELYWFFKNCEQAKCGFSKAFFGSLKVK